jgi:hypothetical protein
LLKAHLASSLGESESGCGRDDQVSASTRQEELHVNVKLSWDEWHLPKRVFVDA